MTSSLLMAPAIGSTTQKTGVFPSASLSELVPPPITSASKRRANVDDTAAIDALFDGGPKQKNTMAKAPKNRGRPSWNSEAPKTDPVDEPPKKSVLKGPTPALSLLSSQHSAAPKLDKDDIPSRPSSSYGNRSQPISDAVGVDSDTFTKEPLRRPRVTFAEPAEDRAEGGFESWGDLGVVKPSEIAEMRPNASGSPGGDSLDFLSMGAKPPPSNGGRRGRPLNHGGSSVETADVVRTPIVDADPTVSEKLHGSFQSSSAGPLTKSANGRQKGETDTDWGDPDNLLAMLPDGSGGTSDKHVGAIQRSADTLSRQPSSSAPGLETSGLAEPSMTGAFKFEAAGIPLSRPESGGSAAGSADLGGYTPSFLGNGGRRRTGVGLGRRPASPLIPEPGRRGVGPMSEAAGRSTDGIGRVSQGNQRDWTEPDGLRRPLSADQAQPRDFSSGSDSLLNRALGGRPATAQGLRVSDRAQAGDIRKEIVDRAAEPAAAHSGGASGDGESMFLSSSGRPLEESKREERFLRSSEGLLGRANERGGDEPFLTRPGSGGVAQRGSEREGEALQQLQADHARALAAAEEHHRQELAAAAAAAASKAARERELLVALHQEELAAKERQAERERAFSSDHQKNLETLHLLVAQVESWSAEVQHMSAATRSEKETMVAEKAEAVKSAAAGLAARESALSAREQQDQSLRQQLEALMVSLDESVKALRNGHAEERARLDGEHARLQLLQESVLAERAAAQFDLAAAREKLEEMRDARLREREAFLAECEAERKALSAERTAVSEAKEQVCLAEAKLDVRIAQHEAAMRGETEALGRDRSDVEKVRECTLEEARAIQRERAQTEAEKAALAAEVEDIHDAARHAQAQLDEAVTIRKEAALLHRDAEALHRDRVARDKRWEAQRQEIEQARDSLSALRRDMDEERYQIAQERRSAGDEKLEAIRMAESARLLVQKAGGTTTERKENVLPVDQPPDRPVTAAARRKKKYASLVCTLVGGSGTLDDVLAARLVTAPGDPWLKERDQGRAYLQSQAEFLAQAEARTRGRGAAATFGSARDCNLGMDSDFPANMKTNVPGTSRGIRAERWGPGGEQWAPQKDGGISGEVQQEVISEVVKRSIDRPAWCDESPEEREKRSTEDRIDRLNGPRKQGGAFLDVR